VSGQASGGAGGERDDKDTSEERERGGVAPTVCQPKKQAIKTDHGLCWEVTIAQGQRGGRKNIPFLLREKGKINVESESSFSGKSGEKN